MVPERFPSGDLAQGGPAADAHPTDMPRPLPVLTPAVPTASGGGVSSGAPAERHGARFYNTLSSSSVGLELGVAVVISLLFGIWLDGKLGTTPWLMLAMLGVGFAAGFRGVMRAVRRSDRAAERGL